MYLDKFSKRLKDLMETEGISKRALSLKINVDRKSIRLWLNGVYFPRHDALIALSSYFHVRVGYLIGLEDNIGEESILSNRETIKKAPDCFCIKLNRYMQEYNMTRYMLAKKLKIDQKALTKWLTRGSTPETATIIKLSRLMNVTADELLGLEK